jgi:glycosyltransferase involved in cell wall biosynthesis
MKILVLSFYYQPDLCAGSFRATALVEALRERMPPSTTIDVVTTLPNRYRSFSKDAPQEERSGAVTIHRIGLPAHRSDMFGQSRAFLSFAAGALRFVRGRRYDLVIATSSRLMTAALGARIARRHRAVLYLDIRDLFVDTIGDLLGSRLLAPLHGLFSLLERWTMRRAARINVVSAGFLDYFKTRYPGLPVACFTNGIDDEFLLPLGERTARLAGDRRAVVLYAGNIGEGQGLHDIVPALASALSHRARFVVIGDGGRRPALQSALDGVDNVEMRDPMTRKELLDAYASADVLFLHLGDYPAFEKVLPSKIFEYAALGKPMLAGVAGFAAGFIREEIDNAAVFPPCDVGAAVAAFESLELSDRPRPAFVAKYARKNIARAMADDILAVAMTGR